MREVKWVSKRLMVSSDPFSAAGTWWEPWALKAHVLTAPLFLFWFGGIYRRHVVVKLRDPERTGRRSGAATLWLIAALTLTGYGLETLTGDTARNLVSLAHIAAGLAFLVAYLLHARLGAVGGAMPAGSDVRVSSRRLQRLHGVLRWIGARAAGRRRS